MTNRCQVVNNKTLEPAHSFFPRSPSEENPSALIFSLREILCHFFGRTPLSSGSFVWQIHFSVRLSVSMTTSSPSVYAYCRLIILEWKPSEEHTELGSFLCPASQFRTHSPSALPSPSAPPAPSKGKYGFTARDRKFFFTVTA